VSCKTFDFLKSLYKKKKKKKKTGYVSELWLVRIMMVGFLRRELLRKSHKVVVENFMGIETYWPLLQKPLRYDDRGSDVQFQGTWTPPRIILRVYIIIIILTNSTCSLGDNENVSVLLFATSSNSDAISGRCAFPPSTLHAGPLFPGIYERLHYKSIKLEIRISSLRERLLQNKQRWRHIALFVQQPDTMPTCVKLSVSEP
jgi:hypothetical protein